MNREKAVGVYIFKLIVSNAQNWDSKTGKYQQKYDTSVSYDFSLMLFTKQFADNDKPKLPHFDGRARIFELDPCNGYGKVCLVYRKATPGVLSWDLYIFLINNKSKWIL